MCSFASAIIYVTFHRELETIYENSLNSPDHESESKSQLERFVFPNDLGGGDFIWQSRRLPMTVFPLENNLTLDLGEGDGEFLKYFSSEGRNYGQGRFCHAKSLLLQC